MDDEHAILHLMRLTGCSRETAERRLSVVREAYAEGVKAAQDNNKTQEMREDGPTISKGKRAPRPLG
jgi:hypothetical protein